MEARLNSQFKKATADKKVASVGAIALDRSGNVLYKHCFGTVNIDDPAAPAFTSSTVATIWSCTKLITAIAALQLLEQGKLALDDPVEKYCPSINKIEVLDGFDDSGAPKCHPPKTKPTILHLLTHTTGFTYDWCDASTLQWRLATNKDLVASYSKSMVATFMTPFVHEPGERWTYGVGLDWMGMVIHAITGMQVEQYIKKNILDTLGMNNSYLYPPPDATRLAVHVRLPDGTLKAEPSIENTKDPEMYGGGQYLYSTLDDYSQILLTVLNYGTHPKTGAQILKEETAKEYLFKDFLPKVGCSNDGVGVNRSTISQLTNEAEYLPGLKKGWSCGFMLNIDGSPKGRNPGSGSWAGIGNFYYWIDPTAGKLGFIMTGILPYLDPEALHLYDEFERALYGHEPAKEPGEKGSNWGPLNTKRG